MTESSDQDAINRVWTDESVTDINGYRFGEMLRTVVEDKCMNESGCDRPATKIVFRTDYWHDDVFCEKCAPEVAVAICTNGDPS